MEVYDAKNDANIINEIANTHRKQKQSTWELRVVQIMTTSPYYHNANYIQVIYYN